MAHLPFHYRRRVHFAETDLAGVVHFSTYFRYMEEAEHALWRRAGLTIARAGSATIWPRVTASFDYKAPLRYDDEFAVHVAIERVGRRSIRYELTIVRGDTLIGTGTMTSVSVTQTSGGTMSAVDVPPDTVVRLRAAIG